MDEIKLKKIEQEYLIKTLIKLGIIKEKDQPYNIGYEHMFKAGLDSSRLKDEMLIDKACFECFQNLGIIEGESYFKGKYHEVFMEGYKFRGKEKD